MRRSQSKVFDELKDLPPLHKSLRQATPEPVVRQIKDLAPAHPA
jgi:hypothetical protein